MTTKAETAVRLAATALQVAIADAESAGLHVQWPAKAADLGAIAISTTGKVRSNDAKPGAAKK